MNYLSCLLVSLLIACSSLAKDLGIQGHIFEIAEPDLLKHMMQKLHTLQKDGMLEKHTQSMRTKTQEKLKNPQALKHITHTQKSRIFYHDPSVRAPFDLKDHKGKTFHRKGRRINPLKYQTLTKPLLFIDGKDKAQVEWALKKKNPTIVLTSGKPFELMETHKKVFYFDQEGRLTNKLNITHVPAQVVQEGDKLKIEEVCL